MEEAAELNFNVSVKNQAIKVVCKPSYLTNFLIHFSFYSPLVSETGYKSHFILREDYEHFKYTSYQQCATVIAISLVAQQVKKNPKVISEAAQMSLFLTN
ncbi:MAG TPA: hypothetical protein VF411_01560 [Bacteroidia bacterium]